MKRLCIALLLVFSAQFLLAQKGGRLAFEDFPKTKKTTLLVLIDSVDSEYNALMRRAVEGRWSLTPYKFVTWDELLPFMYNEDYSMLVPDASEKTRTRVSGTDVIRRSHLVLYNCGNGQELGNYGGKNAITQYELEDIRQPETYAYKLPALVGAMHRYLNYLDTTNITEDNHDAKLNYLLNRDAGRLREMTLLIDEADLIGVKGEWRTAYGYPLEVVNSDVIGEAIINQDSTKAFLHLGAEVEDVNIMATDGTVLFHSKPREHRKLTTGDFTEMGKTVADPPAYEASVAAKISNRLNKLGLGKKRDKKKKKK